MIKYVLTCFLLCIGLAAICQPKKKASVVNLISSERSQGIKRNGADVIKVYHGVFQQDYSILRSDSAYFYPQINSFDAFGHVNINQGDTLNIYSDKLNYNGNTHIALLTDNVKMVDKDATLTTNYLTYNTATRIGTYTGGGKLVNKDNTLTSTNGYYFAYTRDSYFRYNAVLTTVDALIKTDTLRYNTGSRIAYFYGPTHIYGKKNKDTLYTENGLYNTVTEQAFFGKKNLYTQGTKSLKGDSLFYDRLKGYGRAVKNVLFDDKEQKITLHGQLGTYYQNPERTVVTQNPWVTIITEEKDTTKTDSAAPKPVEKTAVDKNKPVDKAQPVISATSQKNNSTQPGTPLKNSQPLKPTVFADSTIKKIDTVKVQLPKPSAVKDSVKNNTVKAAVPKLKGKDSVNTAKQGNLKKDKNTKEDVPKPPVVKETRTKQDTIYMVADTLETRVMTFKALKDLQEERRLASVIDTSAAGKAKRAAKNVKPSKFLSLSPPKMIPDTSYRHTNFFGPPKKTPVLVSKQPGKGGPVKKPAVDSTKLKSDSVYMTHKVVLSDTSRIRILFGHHNAKLFKSDLQAKADSIFYSSADSTIRCYVNPIIWSQGSQMSADTIYLQLKNKKLDNMDLFPSPFIANTEGNDTTYFNQTAGKKMKGYFVDSKLNRMFVDGNAESIYFSRDSTTKQVKEMYRSLSSRIRVNFKAGKVANITYWVKPDQRYGPLSKFTEDERLLKGFIWKPKERPVSKEAIIPELDKTGKYKHTPTPKTPAKGKPVVPGVKGGLPGTLAGKDSLLNKALTDPRLKGAKDSLSNKALMQSGKLNLKDTSALLKQPAIKMAKDSVLKKLSGKDDTVRH